VGAAREAARQEIGRRVAPLLGVERRARLDGLLEVDTSLGVARTTWLRHLPVQASPKVFDDEIEKLRFLRDLGTDKWDLSVLPAKRGRSPRTLGPDGIEPGARPVKRRASLPGVAGFRDGAPGCPSTR
jgi:hypothetical protein